MRRSIFLVFVMAAFAAAGLSETAYRLPTKEITQIIDTAPTPEVVVSPARDAILLVRPGGAHELGHLPVAVHDAAALRVGAGVYVFGGGTGLRQLDTIETSAASKRPMPGKTTIAAAT